MANAARRYDTFPFKTGFSGTWIKVEDACILRDSTFFNFLHYVQCADVFIHFIYSAQYKLERFSYFGATTNISNDVSELTRLDFDRAGNDLGFVRIFILCSDQGCFPYRYTSWFIDTGY